MNPLLLTLLLVVGGDARPASQTARPYELTICIRTADHPMLTDLFSGSVRRQVQDHLDNLFGPLATLRVMTSDHWLVDDYVGQTVDQPELTAEVLRSRRLQGHAILVGLDYVAPDYQLSWRQIDGDAGQIGPVRTRRTPDRQWVAKAVCLAVRDDFPVRASVVGKYIGEATLAFPGDEYQGRLNQLLGDRCVMQLFQIKTSGGKIQRRPVPYSVLLWERDKGPLRATIISKDTDPLRPRPGIGYEAVKLPTAVGRIRLSLRDSGSGAPLQHCQVAINDVGFDELSNADLLSPNRYGVVVSSELAHVAYVRISQGGVSLKLPLPVTTEISHYELSLGANPQALVAEDIDRELRFASRDVRLMKAIQAQAREQINALYTDKQYEEAVLAAEETVAAVASLLLAVKNDVLQQSVNAAQSDDLRAEQARIERISEDIREVEQQNEDLRTQQGQIEEVIATRDAKARAQASETLAKQAKQRGDIEIAIQHYTTALEEYPDFPGLQEQLDTLTKQWEIKNPAHRRAREFFYGDFSNCEIEEVADLLPRAEKQFTVLEENGDFLTAQKLNVILDQRQNEYIEIIEFLETRDGDEDRKELEHIQAVLEEAIVLQERTAEFIQQQLDEQASQATDASPTDQDASAADDDAASPPDEG